MQQNSWKYNKMCIVFFNENDLDRTPISYRISIGLFQ